MELARAAGGLVWRDHGRGRELALVHRPRRDDWSLPKGKLDPDEPWHVAALREVAEETGCKAGITGFAGAKLLVDRRAPKLILYWHMQVLKERARASDDEIDAIAWLSPRGALSRCDQGSDRRLLLRTMARQPSRRAWGEEAGAPSALERLVVVDRPLPRDELLPFVRVIARAVENEASARQRRSAASARQG
jgi:8-oxo-dGTP pyrophosphatase MutT (NUDIX family)